MADLERAFRQGKAGITEEGEVIPIHVPEKDPDPPHNRYLDTWADGATKYPGWLQTTDQGQTCQRCNTAFRASEIKQGRCPFCYRKIENGD